MSYVALKNWSEYVVGLSLSAFRALASFISCIGIDLDSVDSFIYTISDTAAWGGTGYKLVLAPDYHTVIGHCLTVDITIL